MRVYRPPEYAATLVLAVAVDEAAHGSDEAAVAPDEHAGDEDRDRDFGAEPEPIAPGEGLDADLLEDRHHGVTGNLSAVPDPRCDGAIQCFHPYLSSRGFTLHKHRLKRDHHPLKEQSARRNSCLGYLPDSLLFFTNYA